MRDGAAGRDREHGLSEVIGFILLLGVLAAAFALWMMYVVPVNGREDEINQMNDVKDRFTDYKISLDSLWVNSPYGASYSQEGVTLSTSINLGVGGGNSQSTGMFLPLMNPVASSATLIVEPSTDTLNVTSSGPSGISFTVYNLSKLTYQSNNNYWIQQAYYYQDGGVFLYQENGSICRVAPPITFKKIVDSTGTATASSVELTPITLYGGGSIGGNGPVRVDTTMRRHDPARLISETKYWASTCVTVSNYTSALTWLDVFNNARRKGNITLSSYYKAESSLPNEIPGWASMTIYGPSGPTSGTAFDVNLYVQPAEYDVSLNNIMTNLN